MRKRRGRAKSSKRKPTNLTLRSDLVRRAKALGLNLSEVVEASLEVTLAELERSRWLAENEAAIDSYNALVAEHGVFGEAWRPF
jgi:antitoxin CcdA